jgi:hypothetical protein
MRAAALRAAALWVGLAGTVGIIVPAGIITTTIGVGSTTGTWRQFIRWMPLVNDVSVT